jgi:hypothetical protein
MDIEWGGLADWVTGLSTVALAAVTAWGLRTQRQDMKRQQEQLSQQQEQLDEQRELTRRQTELITSQLQAAHRAQAQRVAASEQIVGWTRTNTADDIRSNGYVIKVLNGSDRPIYDVTCAQVLGTSANGKEHRVRPEFAGQENTMGANRLVVPLLDASGRLTRVHPMLRAGADPIAFPFDLAPQGESRYVVTFTDDADVQWQLDEHQRLTEVPRGARSAADD